MTHSISTIARCSAAFFLAGALGFGASASMAEPTAQDMKTALESRFAAINEGMSDVADRCNRRDFQNDPVLAMQCLQIAMTGGLKNGGSEVSSASFNLSRFEKIACEKAQGKPGFICDYIAGMGSNMRALPPSLAALMQNGQMTQARFVQQGTRWLILDAGN